MTDLEQLAELLWDASGHDIELSMKDSTRLAQAIIDAGWTAPPAQTSGYTTHGHPIKGQVQSGKRPPISRCGGPRLCKQCKTETN